MTQTLLSAVALLLVLEGLMPFASPQTARRTMLQIAQLDDRTLRTGGLIAMLSGAVLLYFVMH